MPEAAKRGSAIVAAPEISAVPIVRFADRAQRGFDRLGKARGIGEAMAHRVLEAQQRFRALGRRDVPAGADIAVKTFFVENRLRAER